MAGEVMSEERLAEIKARWRWNSVDLLPTGSQAKMDMRALYDEVKRLRAREAALLTLLRAVATGEPLDASFVEQARGWLQAEAERSGGDGG